MSSVSVALILVAGVGSRLRPLTDDRPKALLDIGGETILGRAVRLLAEHGVEKLVLATGYREDAVRAALADAPLEVSYHRNDRYDSTQNVVSFALCESGIPAGAAFFKLDGDVVFQPQVLQRLLARPEPLAVAVDSHRAVDEEAMNVELGDLGLVTAFGKGIPSARAAGESIGIELVRGEARDVIFAGIREATLGDGQQLYYEDVYSRLIAQGRLVASAVEVGDLPWTEVDTVEDLVRARDLVRVSR